MSEPDDRHPLVLLATADAAGRARAGQVAERLRADGRTVELRTVAAGGGAGARAVLDTVVAEVECAGVLAGEHLPAVLPEAVTLAAVVGRLDPRDALVSHSGAGLATLPRTRPVTVAADGAGRRAQLQRQRRDLLLQEGAGTLEERLAAVERGDLDAAVVGVADLVLARPPAPGLVVVPLEHGEVLHRPGQGATTVVCHRTAAVLRKALAPLDEADAHRELEAERELLVQLSRDADPLVGAHAEVRLTAAGQRRLVLLGLLTDATGSRRARASHETAPEEAVTLGRAMAATLLEALEPGSAPHH